MRKLLLFVLLLMPLLLSAQTSVMTATITDSDVQTWNNGTFTITFVPIQGTTSYQWNGATLDAAHQTFTGSMNGSGVITASIPDSSTISPSGTQWRFTLCSNTSASCSNVTTAVTGASPDLSSTLSAGVTAPRISANFGAHAYADVEMITPVVTGATYYNVTNSSVLVWNGIAWVPSTSGTLSGTTNTVAKFTSSTNVGNGSMFDNGTDYVRSSLGLNTGTKGLAEEYTNANPGTVLNNTVCLDSTQHAFKCGTGNTTGVQGSAVSGVGNSGTVVVCMTQCIVNYDNQTTIGHSAIVSTTLAGALHDTGAATPTAGVDNFIVDSVNSGAGTTALTDILTPRNSIGALASLGGKLPITITNPGHNFLTTYTSTTGLFGQSAIVAGDLPNTAVTPGSYTATNLTVDQQGRITAASNGSGSEISRIDMPADLFSPSSCTGPTCTFTSNSQTYGTMWRTPDAGSTSNPPVVRNPTPTKNFIAATASPFTVNLDSASLAGELIVPIIYSGTLGNTVTDNMGQTYTSDVSGNSGVRGAIFHKANSVAGVTSITVTPGGPAATFDVQIVQLSNAAIASPVDGTPGENDLACSGGLITLPSTTTTNPNDIIISAGAENNGHTLSAGLGNFFLGQFTTPTGSPGIVTYYPFAQFWPVTFAGTYAPTINCTSNAVYVASTVAYKGLASAPTNTPSFAPPTPSLMTQIGIGPLYTINGTAVTASNVHRVLGHCTLGTSCSITLTGAAVFTSSTTYECNATDETAAAAVKFAPSSGSAFALTGTGTDVLSYKCEGY